MLCFNSEYVTKPSVSKFKLRKLRQLGPGFYFSPVCMWRAVQFPFIRRLSCTQFLKFILSYLAMDKNSGNVSNVFQQAY